MGASRLCRQRLVLVIVATLCVSSCVDGPPEIGRELPRSFEQARPVFDQRVKARFPVGSDETRLLAELRRQHFVVRPSSPLSRYPNAVTYKAHQLVCNVSWTVSWRAEAGRIKEIAGDYGDVCL